MIWMSLVTLLNSKLFLTMNKTIKTILEIIKLAVTAILGYYGGSAIM